MNGQPPPPAGIINLNKPKGITSAKALYRVRRTTRVKKSGHAGTLDPMATGVLLLCQGRATKLVERLMDQPKVYRTTARLDVTSDSFDAEQPLIDVPIRATPTLAQIHEILAGFEGTISQIPPRYSAIKLGGLPAYKTVGMENAPEIKPKSVTVYWMHLHAFDWPTIDFEVACGRGTYIRSLIRDIGERLSTGGCLTSLARTAVGPFNLENAWTFDGIESAAEGDPYLTPIEKVIEWLDVPIIIPDRPVRTT